MSYKVSFRDKTSTTITTEDGDNLKLLLLAKNHPPNIEINGELYRASEIISVKQAVSTQDIIPEDIIDPNKRLAAKSRCRGQYSIQHEINKIAHSNDNWGKLVRDKKWREDIRSKLLEQTDQWCDSRTGSCACEEDFLSAKKRHQVGKIF